jgi:hypothetical protein
MTTRGIIMTGQFRSKFSFNIRVITAFVFIIAAVFIMILVIGVTGYAQSPTAPIGGTTIHMPTAGPTIAVTPKPPPAPSENVKEAAAILQNGGKIAEDTFQGRDRTMFHQVDQTRRDGLREGLATRNGGRRK